MAFVEHAGMEDGQPVTTFFNLNMASKITVKNNNSIVIITYGDPDGKCVDHYLHGEEASRALKVLRHLAT